MIKDRIIEYIVMANPNGYSDIERVIQDTKKVFPRCDTKLIVELVNLYKK